MKGISNMSSERSTQEWYTLLEAVEYTRLSSSLLRMAIAEGKLKTTRSNGKSGKLILHKTWLDQFLLGGAGHE
jgi:hypothetical protein